MNEIFFHADTITAIVIIVINKKACYMEQFYRRLVSKKLFLLFNYYNNDFKLKFPNFKYSYRVFYCKTLK